MRCSLQIASICVICIQLVGCSDSNRSECDCSSPDIKDSLAISSLASEGMDSLIINDGIERVAESEYVYSLLIVKNGCIVSESYFNGMTSNDSFSVRSVTKSVIGTLVGIAERRQLIQNTHRKLKDYFPEYFQTVSDPLKNSITIEHLLTMTSGFQWNETADRLYGDYMESAITLPMDNAPGEVFNYNSSNPHLLSGVITKAAQKSTLDFANTYLFDPMNIMIKQWNVDPQGYYLGGTGLFMTARDMAKIGFLYLNHGCYRGKNIICDDWIESAWSDHIADPAIGYGYLWWLMESGGHKIAYAFGYGGQMIYVVKDFQLVVVITADPNVNAQTAQNTRDLADDILISYILPAIH